MRADARPQVLIIGDSISIGYTPHVARLLADQAAVAHNGCNAEHTGVGLRKLDQWLGDTPWRVIHFNWGLWDLCYRDLAEPLKRDRVTGLIAVPLDDYQQNLDRLAARLKQTGARLIWASTTVVPPDEPGRFSSDVPRYNAAAAAVMQRHKIPINDLYALSATFPPDLFVGPGDVHFTDAGHQRLAEQVAAHIRAALRA